ncbi:hypothetical protein ACH4TX_07225 [Streptomyces sp. NPDC021098]|uniref:hypothetical protein n=1 Tax=unclassified Streptomyces TaxID=2593676 RepID=UPI0037AA90BB
MSTASITNRFRGRAGRRLAAAIAVAAALGLGSTACGPDSEADAGSKSDTSASAQSTSGSSSDGSGTSKSGTDGGGSEAPSEGGGVANAGNHKLIVGKLKYLAPGKLTVTPEDGGMEQAFLVANATKILGAAAICTDDPNGGASIGDDGYGTADCTVDELEKAAKTSSVTVRVSMDRKSGGAETVEEKYHP